MNTPPNGVTEYTHPSQATPEKATSGHPGRANALLRDRLTRAAQGLSAVTVKRVPADTAAIISTGRRRSEGNFPRE